MTEEKGNLEEELKPFRDLIPSDVEKELKKAIRENDGDKIKTLLEEKINPILDSYAAKIKNPDLNEGEQTLWVHEVTRGIFHKETVEKWTITNLRAMKYYPVTEENPTQRLDSVGLAVCETVIMNQRRVSKGQRVGNFTGVSSGVLVGTSVGSSTSTSTTYGDLVFFVKGTEKLCFPRISDPHGVQHMIQTIKKQSKR
ncbi:MAG: hypothetical protein ABSD73_07930 [Candidatus Bathyarchaeia archaeon]|jgi:hypothetical protein